MSQVLLGRAVSDDVARGMISLTAPVRQAMRFKPREALRYA